MKARDIPRRMIGRLKTWNRRLLTVRQLQALPDYMLRDIGIEREDIEHVVRRRVNIVPQNPGKDASVAQPHRDRKAPDRFGVVRILEAELHGRHG